MSNSTREAATAKQVRKKKKLKGEVKIEMLAPAYIRDSLKAYCKFNSMSYKTAFQHLIDRSEGIDSLPDISIPAEVCIYRIEVWLDSEYADKLKSWKKLSGSKYTELLLFLIPVDTTIII